jgi:hypothetical protein
MSNPVLAEGTFAITASPYDLPQIAFGFFVEGTGNITYEGANGDVDTITGIPAFTVIPVRIKKVTAATATGIHGFSNS